MEGRKSVDFFSMHFIFIGSTNLVSFRFDSSHPGRARAGRAFVFSFIFSFALCASSSIRGVTLLLVHFIHFIHSFIVGESQPSWLVNENDDVVETDDDDDGGP